jgi:hypothetical protein
MVIEKVGIKNSDESVITNRENEFTQRINKK